MYSLQTTATATLAVALLAPALVLAVAHPVATAGVVVFALAARSVLGVLRQVARGRRGRPQRICVPGTNACVEV